MKTTGNTIFMTGGTSGIGLGLATRLHDLGNKVIISGRRKELLAQVESEHEGIETVLLDVQDPTSIEQAFQTVTSDHPDVNVVITIAGIMLPEDLLDPAHLATAEATVNTNLLGVIRVLTPFAPFLVGKPDAAILTVSSGLGFVPLPVTPTYSATKAAVHMFTEALRVQLAHSGVQVIEMIPPGVQTTLMNQEANPSSMPLEEFLDEVMLLIETQPDAKEILVERVKRLRFAETNGSYDQILAAMSAH